MDRARNRLSAVITPLLKLISDYTGLEALTLLAGKAVEGSADYIVGVVNYGQTKELVPRDFKSWDTQGFDRVIEQFTNLNRYWLLALESYDQLKRLGVS